MMYALPRPYSRPANRMRYSWFCTKIPRALHRTGAQRRHSLEGKALEEVLSRYKHPFSATIGEEAHRRGLPNEMNYVRDYRLIILSTQRSSS